MPSCTALNAARTAISVLPYPTSPLISRSIGTCRSMSALDLVDGRELVRRLHVGEGVLELTLPRGVRAERVPGDAVRAEYSRISSPAIWRTALRARPLVFAQSAPPSLCSVGASPPTYLVTSSSWSVGT